jgi:hypothetical protein
VDSGELERATAEPFGPPVRQPSLETAGHAMPQNLTNSRAQHRLRQSRRFPESRDHSRTIVEVVDHATSTAAVGGAPIGNVRQWRDNWSASNIVEQDGQEKCRAIFKGILEFAREFSSL